VRRRAFWVLVVRSAGGQRARVACESVPLGGGLVCILWGRRAGWQARYVWIAEAGGRTLAVCAPRCGGREAALGGWRPSLAEPRWRQSRGAQAADSVLAACLAMDPGTFSLPGGKEQAWREREALLLLGWRHGQRPCAAHSAPAPPLRMVSKIWRAVRHWQSA
jgi:hypothetical protein